MSKKTLINIFTFILLIVVLGGVFFIVHSTHSSKEEKLDENKEHKSTGPALTRKKDEQAKQEEKKKQEQEEKKKSKKDSDKKDKKNKSNSKENKSKNKSKNTSSSKSDKEQTKQLTKNTAFLLKKTIQDTKNSKEEAHVKDIATSKMINQVDGADDSNANKEIDIRNTSIKFKNTHHFKDKTLNGTFKYDLITKGKDSDSKKGSTTNLDQTSSVKFVKVNGKYKLDKLSK